MDVVDAILEGDEIAEINLVLKASGEDTNRP
jgi:hypothetical protein